MYILIYVTGISQKILSPGPVSSLLMDAPYVHLSNRLSVLEGDQQNTGFFEACGKQSKTTCREDKSQKRKILLLGISYPRTPGQ